MTLHARHNLFSAILRRFDMRLYALYAQWPKDEEMLEITRAFPEEVQSIDDCHFNLYYLARSVRGLAGDTAECGAYRGLGSFYILSAVGDASRKHHIFDSFEGLSEPDQIDNQESEEITRWQKNDLSVSEDVVSANLAGFKNFELYKGWIPDRFDEVENEQFSFVHIDVDLYQPTLDSLSFFYDRTVSGGIILCDDYDSTNCPGAKKAVDSFMSDKPETVIKLSTMQGFIIKS